MGRKRKLIEFSWVSYRDVLREFCHAILRLCSNCFFLPAKNQPVEKPGPPLFSWHLQYITQKRCQHGHLLHLSADFWLGTLRCGWMGSGEGHQRTLPLAEDCLEKIWENHVSKIPILCIITIHNSSSNAIKKPTLARAKPTFACSRLPFLVKMAPLRCLSCLISCCLTDFEKSKQI